MNRLNIFLLLLVVGLLNAFSAEAAFSCTGFPSLSAAIKQGQPCGGNIPCEAGNYCDINGICSALKAVGEACIDLGSESGCPSGTKCFGSSATNKKCQTYANPGETCSDTNGPLCGGNLDCDGVTNKCTTGQAGDGCKNDVDCDDNLKCSNKVCKTSAAVGDSCILSVTCGFNQYCNTNSECAKSKTSGVCTGGDCASGYECVEDTFKADAKKTCLKRHAVAAGEWCFFNDQVCASGICHRGHCAGKSPVNCGNCVIGETCSCDGGYLWYGTGVCKEDKCSSLLYAYSDCVGINCGSSSLDYTQSCANLSCGDAWNAYLTCDPLQTLTRFF